MIDFIFNPELSLTLGLTNGILIIFYLIFHFLIRYSQKSKEKEFSQIYVNFLGEYTINTNIKFLSVLFTFQIIGFTIAFFTVDALTSGQYVKHIYMPSLFAAVLYIFLFCKKTGNKLNKEVIMKSKADVVVDFNFNALKKIFNIYLEIPVSVIILYFASVHYNFSTIIIFFGLITWLNYFSLKNSKNMDRVMFKYTYMSIAAVNLFYQALLIFVYIKRTLNFEGVLEWYDLGLYYILGSLLVIKTILYIVSLPKLKKIVTFSSGEVNGSTINA